MILPQVVVIVATKSLPLAAATSGCPEIVLGAESAAGGLVQPGRMTGVAVGVGAAVGSVVAADVGESVADVVGDAAGVLSERFVRTLAPTMKAATTTSTPMTAKIDCLSRTDWSSLMASGVLVLLTWRRPADSHPRRDGAPLRQPRRHTWSTHVTGHGRSV